MSARVACRCGWAGTYTSAGHAAKQQRSHDCSRDWSPRPCVHGGIHRHGTRAAYSHCGCRCEACRAAARASERDRLRQAAYGRSTYVDADQARAHVLELLAAGMGHPRIAAAAGVDRSTVIRLIWGKSRHSVTERTRRLRRDHAAALAAVQLDLADAARVTVLADTTARRLRALVAVGWYPALLARETGYAQAYLDRLIQGHRSGVRPGTARRVHAIYRRLAATRPPESHWTRTARDRARREGWQPPILVGGRPVVGTALDEEVA